VGKALGGSGSAEHRCRLALDRALTGFDASAGAIFLARDGRLEPAAIGGPAPAPGALLEEVASLAVAASEPRVVRSSPAGSAARSREALAVPLSIDGRPVGTMVLLKRDPATGFGPQDLALADALSTELALALDLVRLEDALDRRTREADLLRRQLGAYALDVRETFSAEKQRAEELARALTELEQTYLATVRGLAVAVEAKDAYTAGHLVRVTRYGLAMMRLVAPAHVSDPQFEYGFLLHDIGKLGVPDAVLGKPGPLTEDEWRIMRKHPETGASILEGIPFLAGAKQIVCTHHERWDGRGYPAGLRAEEIPLGARVFPLADAFDAMTTDRPYRPAMSVEEALAEVRAGSGTQFCPEATEAFLTLPREQLEEARTASARLRG
jgi:ribonuclease P protein subunit RPR2